MKWLEAQLFEYLRGLRDEQGIKTLLLPSGRVSSTARPAKAVVTDADAFITWASANRPELLHVDVKPDVSAIRSRLIQKDEIVVDPATGEPVPGVTVEPSSLSFNAAAS